MRLRPENILLTVEEMKMKIGYFRRFGGASERRDIQPNDIQPNDTQAL
jgi:hypothetical protein